MKGALFIVGGVITKPIPRKDVDVVAIVDEGAPPVGLSPYRSSIHSFEILRQLVNEIASQNNSFTVTKVIEPLIDPEYGSESIMKHNGSITMQVRNGIPIEFINRDVNIAAFIKYQQDHHNPFTRLA